MKQISIKPVNFLCDTFQCVSEDHISSCYSKNSSHTSILEPVHIHGEDETAYSSYIDTPSCNVGTEKCHDHFYGTA
jgi:hypothetical protein